MNEGHPSCHTSSCTFLAWWISPQRGSWQQTIDSRSFLVQQEFARLKRMQQRRVQTGSLGLQDHACWLVGHLVYGCCASCDYYHTPFCYSSVALCCGAGAWWCRTNICGMCTEQVFEVLRVSCHVRKPPVFVRHKPPSFSPCSQSGDTIAA